MAELCEGDWVYSLEHREVVRVIEARRLWGHVAYRVFLPSREAVARIRGDGLVPVSEAADGGSASLVYAMVPAIRQHRLSELECEAAAFRSGLARREYVAPELDAIVLLRVESAP